MRNADLYTLQVTQSSKRKPLSSIIAISGLSRVRIPDSTKISLSLTETAQKREKRLQQHGEQYQAFPSGYNGTYSLNTPHSGVKGRWVFDT